MAKILVFLSNTEGTIKEMTTTLYQYQHLNEEMKARGIEIEESSLPQPENIEGKHAKLMYNTETGEFFYKYEDRPLTAEEELAKVRAENEILTESLIDFKTQYMAVPCQNHQDYPVVIDKIIEEAKKDGTV
ncbi:hypothetical protein [Bacillus badius]|uniref:Uncharacterized protein n=1 Tax=Bacillus badius TaxID=1455 RepID=A0ABR5AP57_BACBA|nr:hypothetical protein [Bacillus badius]KIL72510.1 hypothetical protein SD77_3483 [Bacillus badius]MED4718289.1 hypothetical protein [Bacillus badius]